MNWETDLIKSSMMGCRDGLIETMKGQAKMGDGMRAPNNTVHRRVQKEWDMGKETKSSLT